MSAVFDLHCDTVWQIYKAKKAGREISLTKSALQVDEEKLLKGKHLGQCFAVFSPYYLDDPYAAAREMLDIYDAELQKCAFLQPVLQYRDFADNQKTGKISAVLTMEDGSPIGEDLSRIQEFYKRGVRMIGLSWNGVTPLGYPNISGGTQACSSPLGAADTQHGLTELGKAAVKEMHRLGIAVDLAHLSDAGFYDAIAISEKPVVVSHANARSVCGHARNLSDDMLKRLADRGGVVGLTFVKQFLNENREEGAKTTEQLLFHLRHIRKIAGIDCIALGGDYDGAERGIELDDASTLPILIERLQAAGFTENEIEKIAYKNALRVFRECWR